MALKRSNEIKVVESDTELELTPDEGEAIRVKRIEVKTSASEDFASVYIGRAIAGYFAVALQGYNHLAPVISGTSQENIFETLRKAGKPLIFPVAEGETLKVEVSNTATFIKAVYDVYDAGDVSSEEPNGSKSKELTYIAYLTNESAFDETGYYTLDKMRNPVEFPNFPVESVPSKASIEVLGVMGIPLATSKGDGSATLGTSYTTRFRIFYQRQVLFDPDRNGWLFKGNDSYTETSTTQSYDYTEVANEIPFAADYNKVLKLLDPTLKFGPGEEANFQVGATIDSDAPIGAEKLIVALLQKVTFE